MNRIRVILAALLLCAAACHLAAQPLFLEAEAFDHCGGWVNDNRSVPLMGSPYLMAHGLGVPVSDASTDIQVSKGGSYRLWVRTRDWTRSWGKTESPGRFQVLVNGQASETVFGTESADWDWQDGGIVFLQPGSNRIALHDLTGFNGRCDALYLTPYLDAPAPVADEAFRRKMTGKRRPAKAGNYDFVVVGGGIAGCCAAVTAARLGCKVALIQDRPVLGGNNSSEIRVGLSGKIFQDPYPKLGLLMDELAGFGYHNRSEARSNPDAPRSQRILAELKSHPERMTHNAGPASNYDDPRKQAFVQAEPNITLFLNMQVISVRMRGSRIRSVLARDISTGEEIEVRGDLFSDCTGDGDLGFLSGADWRMGRESKAETGEPRAPEQADRLTMGTSVQWYASDSGQPTAFPECPWAMAFNDSTCVPRMRGDWDWEAGLGRDQIVESEYIRDLGLRAAFGNWSYLKNSARYKEKFANKTLTWVAAIGGKRESRRLMGDVILREQDLLENVKYEDGTFTTTWGVDLHYPKPTPGMEGEEPFRASSIGPGIKPFAVPYRCLYSRNIDNLMMAGRDISVTHVALGTVRVMRTGGMMGEVVGMAASLCRRHRCRPRAIYTDYLEELKALMRAGVPASAGRRRFSILAVGDSITQGSEQCVSYIFPLRKQLLAAGLDVDFIGPRTRIYDGDTLQHCGFGGKTVEYLDAHIDSLYRLYPADVVLIHAGHNHFVEKKPVPGIIEAHRSLIDKIRRMNPEAVIFVAQVIESGKLPKYSYIPELNEALAGLVRSYASDRVRLVAAGKGFDWRTDANEDHVHPNADGAAIMAGNWAEAMLPVLAKMEFRD